MELNDALALLSALASTGESEPPPSKRGKRGSESSTDESLSSEESALRRLEEEGSLNGFTADTLDKLISVTHDIRNPATLARLFQAAKPVGVVKSRTAVDLLAGVPSLPCACQKEILNWLIAIWDAIEPSATPLLFKLYFIPFKLMEYEALLPQAACLVCRMTKDRTPVTAFRVRRLTRLFDRTGSAWPALVLSLYHRFAPDMFVLPFDARVILGKEVDEIKLLANPIPLKKKFEDWRKAIDRIRTTPLPVPDIDFISNVPKLPAKLPGPSSSLLQGSLIPEPTYTSSFLAPNKTIKPLCEITKMSEIALIAANKEAVMIPDHFASVAANVASLQYANLALLEDPINYQRLKQWAFWVARRICSNTVPPDGALRNLSSVIITLRETFDCLFVALPTFVETSKEARKVALLLMLPTVDFTCADLPVLVKCLQPLVSSTNTTNASLALIGFSRLVSREVLMARRLSKLAWQLCTAALDVSGASSQIVDAVLTVLVAMAHCSPEVLFPQALLQRLWMDASDQTMISRVLGVIVLFFNLYTNSAEQQPQGSQADLPFYADQLAQTVELAVRIRNDLTSPDGLRGLCTHPSLQALFARFMELASMQANQIEQKPPTMEDVLRTSASRKTFIDWLRQRDFTGISEFMDQFDAPQAITPTPSSTSHPSNAAPPLSTNQQK